MEIDKLLLYGIIFGLIFLGGFSLNGYINSISNNGQLSLFSVKTNNSNCSGMDLMFTSKCLNKQLSSFFFYNTSQKGKTLTESELRQSGGVCSSASEWYQSNTPKNYYGSTCSFKVYEDSNKIEHYHEIFILASSEGYSVLDQKSILGYEYFNINKSKISINYEN